MSKKKTKKQEEAESLPYEIKAWSGLPLYCCALCQFDTLSEDALFEHLASQHFEPTIANNEFPAQSTSDAVVENEMANGVFEIDLKEDQ